MEDNEEILLNLPEEAVKLLDLLSSKLDMSRVQVLRMMFSDKDENSITIFNKKMDGDEDLINLLDLLRRNVL